MTDKDASAGKHRDKPLDATAIIDRYYDSRYRLYGKEYEEFYGKSR